MLFDWSLHRDSFVTLKRNEPLILASATSFFATFSLSPIIVILVNVLGLYFRNDDIRRQLIGKLEGMFGPETSRYVEGIVNKVSTARMDWMVALAGFLFLLFVATNMLKIVKQSIHKIWQIKRKHVSALKYNFSERSIAVGILLGTGIFVGLSALADTSIALLNTYLHEQLPTFQLLLIRILNLLFSLLIGTTWFTIIFKVLPDARIHWRVCLGGGFVTTLLFTFGKFVLGKLLLYNSLANIFGPSASFVLILLFIFYSSLILYYGAAFTYVYAARRKLPIHAGKYSEAYRVDAVSGDVEGGGDDDAGQENITARKI
jgi:membrane protein